MRSRKVNSICHDQSVTEYATCRQKKKTILAQLTSYSFEIFNVNLANVQHEISRLGISICILIVD